MAWREWCVPTTLANSRSPNRPHSSGDCCLDGKVIMAECLLILSCLYLELFLFQCLARCGQNLKHELNNPWQSHRWAIMNLLVRTTVRLLEHSKPRHEGSAHYHLL